MKKIRLLLWKLHVWDDEFGCPYCGKDLVKHGYEPEEYYSCENKDCTFGTEETKAYKKYKKELENEQ